MKLYKLMGLTAADITFFSFINPIKAYAFVIIVGFALLVLTIYVLIDFLLLLGERIIPLSMRTKRRIALAMTMVIGLLIAMQSIGQLTYKDILAVIPLVIVMSFYFSYLQRSRP